MTEDTKETQTTETTDLLVFENRHRTGFEFRPIDLDGDLAAVLSGEIKPEQFTGGRIGTRLAGIFKQFREQSLEYKTCIAHSLSSGFSIQVHPIVGTEDDVNNVYARPPEGKKVIEIHNHLRSANAETGKVVTHAFFSQKDLPSFGFRDNERIAEAVSFEEGTAILIKTQKSKDLISQKLKDTGQKIRPWVALGNELIEEFETEVPNNSFRERREFSINFAQKHHMRLLFVPNDSEQIEILV
jgi:hypothetical protein